MPVGIAMKVNEKIRELRKNAKLTQVQLSNRAGVGLRFLRELERGKPTVRSDKVRQVLEFFGYHLEAIRDEREKI
jgi:y4mF family transcriptional regulator